MSADDDSPLASIHRAGGRAVLWDAALASRSPLFWPLTPANEALAAAMDGGAAARTHAAQAAFPQPETIDAALAPRAGIRFERQRPVARRRSDRRNASAVYDGRIAREGCVPTRPGSWHDLMNALVWATFPLAKRALHRRQHGLVVPAAPGESARRPRELDALALFDEGGVVVVSGGVGLAEAGEEGLGRALAAGEATALVFGHAIYEGLVLGRPAPLASVVCVGLAGSGGEGGKDAQWRDGSTVELADRALAAALADQERFGDPASMLRVRADDRLARP